MSQSEPSQRKIQLSDAWLTLLQDEFSQPYMQQLRAFLLERKRAGARIYPPGRWVFNALNATGPDDVRVVILGQDPYHGPGQAHGLCFSVQRGVSVPPSLANIYKELAADIGFRPPGHGHLQSWAERGVLLLNAVLTVEQGNAGAHQGKGWERFTDRIVQLLSEREQPTVFMLWGAQAQRKGENIDVRRHRVLKAPHPSPLSAHRGFFGCNHFSKANEWLQAQGLEPVDWTLSMTEL